MALTRGARALETRVLRWSTRRAVARGWQAEILGYTGLGSEQKLRLWGRVLLADPNASPRQTRGAASDRDQKRGWRQFITLEVGQFPLQLSIDGTEHAVTTDNEGYFELVLSDHGLSPGWHEVTISAGSDAAGRAAATGVPQAALDSVRPHTADILIIGAETRFGIISDIDDTVLVTSLPRALVAAWNSWFTPVSRRRAVPGMAQFFAQLRADFPDAPVIYLSTGAWNTFGWLRRFFRRHNLPDGPMLLTDWGPTAAGLFRSGQQHKHVSLRNLVIDFPEISWILIGDDGQHDPLIYSTFIREHPEHCAAVAIRNLSAEEHLLSHGTPQALRAVAAATGASVLPDGSDIAWWEGANGAELAAGYRASSLARHAGETPTPEDR